ncbi:hypothetical protein JX266_006333 [Neoarthrinium moseri]|nr:hypothetical protein JX266_006333 [Neoarthrinium moseri]
MSSLGLLKLFQYVGGLTTAYAGYRLYNHLTFYLLPSQTLDRWRQPKRKPWALVTGSSAGIGFGTAQELAGRGFNVVLLGHLEAELLEAQSLIQAENAGTEVRTLVLDATSATPDDIKKSLGTISDLPLTILVNNVGGFPMKPPQIRNLMDFSAEELDRSLNINACFMSHVTRSLLPQLARNGPSLVLNVSSAARMGIPGIVPYSACKGFIISFSTALSREMAAARVPIDVLAIIPGDVKTQANTIGLTPGTPTAREYAGMMLNRAPRAVSRGWTECAPFWPHALQIGFIESLPNSLALRLLIKTFEDKKRASEEREKRK